MPFLKLMHKEYGDKPLCEYWSDRPETIESARSVLTPFRERGMMMFSIEGPGNHRLVTELDPEHDCILIPPIQGG